MANGEDPSKEWESEQSFLQTSELAGIENTDIDQITLFSESAGSYAKKLEIKSIYFEYCD